MSADSRSFEAVFTAHAAFAWRVLRRYGVPERELEDVCQEVFVVVLQALPAFEGRSSLKTWIYGVCRRVAANHQRRAVVRREVPHAATAMPERARPEPDAFDALASKQTCSQLDALLERLPSAQREVFVLYEIDELTMREIADALGCPMPTAFSRLYAARRGLAAELQRLRIRESVA